MKQPNFHPPRVLAVLQAAERAGYRVKWENRQNTSLLYRGSYVGGWNCTASHWYIRDTAVGKNAELLRRHRFSLRSRASGQLHWQLAGEAGAPSFKTVVGELTGVPIVE